MSQYKTFTLGLILWLVACRGVPRAIDLELADFGDPPVDYRVDIERFYVEHGSGETLKLFIGYPQKGWWHHGGKIVYGWEVPVDVTEFGKWLERDYHCFGHGQYYGAGRN